MCHNGRYGTASREARTAGPCGEENPTVVLEHGGCPTAAWPADRTHTGCAAGMHAEVGSQGGACDQQNTTKGADSSGGCRPDEVKQAFERYGEVRDVYMPKDYYSGCVALRQNRPLGLGFVRHSLLPHRQWSHPAPISHRVGRHGPPSAAPTVWARRNRAGEQRTSRAHEGVGGAR